MVSLRSNLLSAVAVGVIAGIAGPAIAQGQLNVICSVQADWCGLAAVEFEKETGVTTTMSEVIRNSTFMATLPSDSRGTE